MSEGLHERVTLQTLPVHNAQCPHCGCRGICVRLPAEGLNAHARATAAFCASSRTAFALCASSRSSLVSCVSAAIPSRTDSAMTLSASICCACPSCSSVRCFCRKLCKLSADGCVGGGGGGGGARRSMTRWSALTKGCATGETAAKSCSTGERTHRSRWRGPRDG